jgi:hypothetical protein
MSERFFLFRNDEVGDLLEIFLVSAVVSILIIRFYLMLTGYPQIGGGSLHIAHMLWGGLLMLFALVFVFSFAGKKVLKITAVVGGIGFGTFIDELGKFITNDNDYFFQPTIALLYVLFIILFFTFRFIQHNKPLSQKEYLINALRLLEDAVIKDLGLVEKKKLILYLEKAHTDETLTKHLRSLAHEIKTSSGESNIFSRMYMKCYQLFYSLFKSPFVKISVQMLFTLQAFSAIATIVLLLVLEVYKVPSKAVPIPAEYIGIA